MKNRKLIFSKTIFTATSAVLVAATAILGQGCATTTQSLPPESAGRVELGKWSAGVPEIARLDESPIIVGDLAAENTEQAELNLDELRQSPASPRENPEPAVASYPASLLQGLRDPDDEVRVMLNLDATPLTEVVPLFGELLGFSFLIDPSVRGTVTMMVDSEITAREVWEMFEHVLWLAGSYASPNSGFLHVVPFQKMSQERRLAVNHQPRANVEVALLPMKYWKSEDMIKHLQPFTTEGATLTNLPNLNSLMVVETPANLPKLREIVALMDQRGEAAWPRTIIQTRHVDAATVKENLESLLPVLGLPVSNSGPSGGEIKITAIPRLHLIIASSAIPEVLPEIENWVRVLDRQDASEQENLFFYNVHHSTADHLAEALSVFFPETRATMRSLPQPARSAAVSSAAEATGSRERRENQHLVNNPGGEARPRPTIFDTPLVVFVDNDQNRLTIRTTGRAYAMVEALLRRLDVPPRQVLIQAVVADVTLSKSTEFGVSYTFMQRLGNTVVESAVIGATGIAGNNFPLPRSFSDGAAILFKQGDDKMALLRAVAGDSNVRVLSAPQIMASNDQEAIINVGDRVPIITGDFTDVSAVKTPADGGIIHRNIQYTDVGVILTVTPRITAGNEVRLKVVQEVSDAIRTETSGIDSPTIRNRQLSTTMVVPDGGTALLGGLIRTRQSEVKSGVPLLMRIPVAGAVFRNTSKEDQRTELLVLITVNVVESHTPTDILAHKYQAALREIQEKLEL